MTSIEDWWFAVIKVKEYIYINTLGHDGWTQGGPTVLTLAVMNLWCRHTPLIKPALLLESEPRSHIGFGDIAPSCDFYYSSREQRSSVVLHYFLLYFLKCYHILSTLVQKVQHWWIIRPPTLTVFHNAHCPTRHFALHVLWKENRSRWSISLIVVMIPWYLLLIASIWDRLITIENKCLGHILNFRGASSDQS